MDVRYISAIDAYNAAKEGTLLLDVREEIETSDIWINMENVVSVPFKTLIDTKERLPKNERIILCCAIGIVSKEAATLLMENGYTDVFVLENGLVAWKLADLPLKSIEDMPCQCQCNKDEKNGD